MTVVKGPDLVRAFAPSVAGTRCEAKLRALARKKKIDLAAIGSPANNLLIDLLKCHTKATKKNHRTSASQTAPETAYASCHASVMGTGNYRGHQDCRAELAAWLAQQQHRAAAAAAATVEAAAKAPPKPDP